RTCLSGSRCGWFGLLSRAQRGCADRRRSTCRAWQKAHRLPPLQRDRGKAGTIRCGPGPASLRCGGATRTSPHRQNQDVERELCGAGCKASGDPAIPQAMGRVWLVTERVILALATLILAVIGLLPVAAMLKESVTADGGFSLDGYRALLGSEGQLAPLLAHSLALSLLSGSVSALGGVALGVLLGKTDLPLRGSLTLLFTVPLLLPPYVLAVAWFSILGRTGLLGAALPDSWLQKISLEFFGLSGC